jgi:hypothetical protein
MAKGSFSMMVPGVGMVLVMMLALHISPVAAVCSPHSGSLQPTQ